MERKTLTDFAAILAQCSYGDWNFHVYYDGDRPVMQIKATSLCNVTGEPLQWTGRKWFLSEHMTRSEVVQTAFKAVLTAVEHEAREQFLYRGASIFDPHYNVDLLWALRTGEEPLDERKDGAHAAR